LGWRRDLMLWHPRLWTMADDPSRSPGCPRYGRGWEDILVRLCRRIEIAPGARDSFGFVRIVQKLGILRVDFDDEASEGAAAEIDRAVDLAVARSACTCEPCGREGGLHDEAGRFGTRCDEHAVALALPCRADMPKPSAGCAAAAAGRKRISRAATAQPTR
jgi:hypothetical protein